MKTVPIKARQPLPPAVLRQADTQPVVLTVRGKPRYLLRAIKPTDAARLARGDTSEDTDWVESASTQLLEAYAEEDAIYDTL